MPKAFGTVTCLPRLAVAVFALLVVAGIWAVTAQRVLAYRDTMRRDAEIELYGAQKTLHAHLRRTLETAQVMLAATDQLLGDGYTPMDDVEGILKRLQSFDQDPIEIGLVSTDKWVWLVGGARGQGADASDRTYAKALEHARPGDLHVDPVYRTRLTKREVLTLAMKARPNRHGVDVILAAVPTEHFKDAYSELLISAPAYLGILRQDGLALYLSTDPNNMTGRMLRPGFLDTLRREKGASGITEYGPGVNVKNLLAGYAMLETLPITLFVGIDLDLLEAKWRSHVLAPILIGAAVTVLALVFLALILFLMARRDAEAAQVKAALRSAEAANNAKRHFMARMSHELRTPLNAILGFSEIISGGILGSLSDTYKRYGGDIHRSGQHLLSLVNQVLEIARLEAGAMALNETPCTLRAAITEVVELMRLQAAAKRLQLGIGEVPETAMLHADPLLLRQMLLNLLSNAVKYTEPGGSIMVAATPEADGLAITVSDTGRGIADGEKIHIFEPFGRGNAMVARHDDGFGLGLPIVRSLIELHGGRIELRSAPRQGTSATLHFPSRRILEAA